MKIGKLDPKNLFDKSPESEYLEKEKEMFNNIVIGKLNTNNIFENDQTKEVEKKTIQVGKIKTKVLLLLLLLNTYLFMYLLQELFTDTDTYVAKPYVTVGKLKIKVKGSCYHGDQIDEHPPHFKESDLFEKREEDDSKQTLQIGKIQTKDLFSSSSNEEKGFIFISR